MNFSGPIDIRATDLVRLRRSSERYEDFIAGTAKGFLSHIPDDHLPHWRKEAEEWVRIAVRQLQRERAALRNPSLRLYAVEHIAVRVRESHRNLRLQREMVRDFETEMEARK